VVICALVLALGPGCRRGARSPEEAFSRYQRAVAARDPGALFDALDQQSRWAWMTVQKSHREAYDIILSNYPEGQERERALRRFERAATLGSARDLFSEEVGRGAVDKSPNPVPAAERFELSASGKDTVAVLSSGVRLPFRKGQNDRWGFAGFADDAEERQNRALRDVDTVRVSAADYERAAARNAR
jgi:hypothetical protein